MKSSQTSSFPESTKRLILRDACKEIEQRIANNNAKCSIILYRDFSKRFIKRSFKTFLLGYGTLRLRNFKNLAFNELYNLFDKTYSRVGLNQVFNGSGAILDSCFRIEMPVDIPDLGTYVVRRDSYVRKIIDGENTYDALIIYFEFLRPYTGRQPMLFLPEFRDAQNQILEKETNELRYIAGREIIRDKDFCISGKTPESKAMNISIFELIADGYSDCEIADILNVELKDIRNRKKDIAKKCRKFLTPNYSYLDIAYFFKDNKLFL